MKKLIILLVGVFCLSFSYAQTKQYLRADSLYIQRDGGNGELILLNGTRDSTGGLLTNVGKGRTAFLKVKVVNDSSVIIGKDTLVIRGKQQEPPPNDYVWLVYDSTAYFNETIVSAYGYTVTTCNKIILPSQFQGKRIRVSNYGWRVPENDAPWGTFYKWDPATRELKIFPRYDLNEHTIGSYEIEVY